MATTSKPRPLAGEWIPRPIQREILEDPSRYRVAVLHRRAGKTAMAVRWLKEVLDTAELPNPRVVYLTSTLKSAKNIAWQMVLDTFGPAGAKSRGCEVKKYNGYDLSVEFHDGSHLQLLSATNYQAHRGVYLDGIVLDEVDLIPPSAFDAVFRPALVDRKGRAMFIGTPLGRGHLFDRFSNAGKSAQWASWRLTAEESGIIDPEELEDLRATMPSPDFAREMMVDFDVAAAGAYYAVQMNEARDDGRILELPHREDDRVTCSWFFGKRDDVVVTFWRQNKDWLDCFDVIWKQQTSLEELLEEIKGREYEIVRHVAPGSAKIGPGTRIDYARSLGVQLKKSKQLELMDRVYATKPVLSRCRFAVDVCADVIEGLRQYRAEYDEVAKAYDDKPVNDWTLGFAGSVEAFATDYNPKRSDWSKPIKYPQDEVSSRAA